MSGRVSVRKPVKLTSRQWMIHCGTLKQEQPTKKKIDFSLFDGSYEFSGINQDINNNKCNNLDLKCSDNGKFRNEKASVFANKYSYTLSL